MSNDRDASRLAAESLAAGDPTGWFDRLYTEAAAGSAIVPWDGPDANALLTGWAAGSERRSGRAMVVGCGLGRDAEFVSSLGYVTSAFDVSPAAVAGARARYPGTSVDYTVADLLHLPGEWLGAFDLVVESHTVQSLPVDLHGAAIDAVTSLVAPSGTLLVLAAARAEAEDVTGPPWPLTPTEIDRFGSGLVERTREQVPGEVVRWRVEFVR